MQSYISVKLTTTTSARDSLTRRRNFQQVYRTKGEIRRAACKSCLQKTIAFLFTQVGVGALLVGYTILGALVFVEIESPTESRRLLEVKLLKEDIVGQLWNVTHNYNVLDTRKWRHEVELIVENFQHALVKEIRLGYDGSSDPIWTFPSALMYSLSVFTTIGYGNLTPKTDWGKALTVFYALFGIPLLLLYFSNVGNFLATSLRKFYSSFNRCRSSLEKMKSQARMDRVLAARRKKEGDGDPKSFSTRRSQRTSGGGVSGTLQISGGVGGVVRGKEYGAGSDSARGSRCWKTQMDLMDSIPAEEQEEEDNEYWTNEVTIPISTCLALFSCYIMMGSVVFSWWENWNYLDGSYFCFVSLVTIGFGDLVPGSTEESRRDYRTVGGQLIFCSIYILVGMGIMAMLFHLTQERFFIMARRIGKFLHLL